MELREVVEFLKDPSRFAVLGARVPTGAMLYGPPGTGKTLLAKAVAGESGAMFYSQSASQFVEMFAGLGAARIRKLFETARKNAPAIIFIDELDAVGTSRGNDISREKDQTLNQLLVEMDGFGTADQVVVIGATNRLDSLDAALLRAGRFDRQVFVGPPDLPGRVAILKVHTKNKPLAEGLDLELVARRTPGATGADLANICNEAAIFAGRQGRVAIEQQDFNDAFERVVAGLSQPKVMSPEEKRIVAYHEAGHALMARVVNPPKAVHKVTIVPSGQALGYVMRLPEEDKYLESREELINELVVLLGGRAAEELIFGRVTTGAESDLARVTQLARRMVFDWGMGTTITSLALKAENYALSEQTKQLRDEEQRQIADQAYEEARRLLREHSDALERLAQALLEREVLDAEELLAVLDLPDPEPIEEFAAKPPTTKAS
jgi:cell division protease FtsH